MTSIFNQRNIIAATVALFCFGIGLAAGILIKDWPILAIDTKVSVTTIVQIVVTLFLGIYVAQSIQGNKTEKELIIKRIETINGLIDEMQREIAKGSVNYLVAVAHTKKLTLVSSGVVEAIALTSIKLYEDYNNQVVDVVKELRRNYTSADVTPGIPKIEVKDNILTIPNNVTALINVEYERLRKIILLWQLAINKA